MFYSCIAHVEHVAQDLVVAEEAEGQEELYTESEAVEPAEELAPEANSANSFSQPGKHRFILNPASFKFESCNYYYTYAFKFIGIV